VRQRAVVGRKAGDSEEASTSQTGRRWLRRAAFPPAVDITVSLIARGLITTLDSALGFRLKVRRLPVDVVYILTSASGCIFNRISLGASTTCLPAHATT
jgi:hypothetical protein